MSPEVVSSLKILQFGSSVPEPAVAWPMYMTVSDTSSILVANASFLEEWECNMVEEISEGYIAEDSQVGFYFPLGGCELYHCSTFIKYSFAVPPPVM